MKEFEELWEEIRKRAEELQVRPDQLFAYTILEKAEKILKP